MVDDRAQRRTENPAWCHMRQAIVLSQMVCRWMMCVCVCVSEGNRASVMQTTKVRTKLKGDGSWMQRTSEPLAKAEEEVKPW